MSQGVSVHIGLNHVDDGGYPDLIVPELAGCLNDANDMQLIASVQGFSSTVMLDGDATADAVKQAISDAAAQLSTGDIFLLTYSGHGSQVPDTDNEEEDAQDETWVLYDRMLLDDELYDLWSQFQAGVRIFVLSDSCHSGTVARMLVSRVEQVRDLVAKDANVRALLGRTVRDVTDGSGLIRGIPADLARKTWIKRRDVYEHVKYASRRGAELDVQASVILISGCQDNQTSLDGTANGLFTQTLKGIWQASSSFTGEGTFTGDHPSFKAQISAGMPAEQTPNYYTVGATNESFEAQRPFTIEEPSGELGAGTGGGTGGEEEPVQTGRPSVIGPSSWSRNDTAPTFTVDTAGAPYYVFEIASGPELFDWETYGQQRTADTFYATWDDPAAQARMTDEKYELSADAWSNLNASDQLFFRIGTTTSQAEDEWNDYQVSTDDTDGASAPSIQLTE